MLLLSTTSSILRVVTGSAGDIEAAVSWVDVPVPFTPASNSTPSGDVPTNITTAATTTIVAAPGASTCRNVKDVSLHNHHATVANLVTVEEFDGTDSAVRWIGTLLPGERVALDETGAWTYYSATGVVKNTLTIVNPNMGPAGAIAETIPREICPEVNTTVAASGTLFMQSILLKAGQVVSAIGLCSATTAAGTPTNYFCGLYSPARTLLATSANQTTTAWAANTYKQIAMTAPYTVPEDGIYYIGYFMTATTVATLKGGTAKTGGQLALQAPILHGISTTGNTTALPATAAAITSGTVSIYAAVF